MLCVRLSFMAYIDDGLTSVCSHLLHYMLGSLLNHKLDGRTQSLLIPLNVCRRKNMYLPWHCEDERHGYEKCVY